MSRFRLRALRFLLPFLLLPGFAAAAPETWVTVKSPYFTVLTTAHPAQARAWALELERFRSLLREFVSVPETRLRPVTVVLFASDKAMQPYKPVVNGKSENLAGLFVNFCDSHAIELSLDGNPERIRRVIFHEAVHWYSSAGDETLPAWLEEGMAEVYSTFSATPDGECSFGKAIPEHVQLLRSNPKWSLEQMLSTRRDSIDYNERKRTSIFYAASWLTAHYLLFGRATPGRDAVDRYLAAREHSEAATAFTQAFGTDYAGFKTWLSNYLDKGKYTIRSFRYATGEIERSLVSRPATAAEVDLALATLLIGARPDRLDEADQRLARAVALAPENPVVWQVLGERAFLEKKYPIALGYFEKATAAGSTSYFAHYGLGYCRSLALSSVPGALDDTEARKAADNFRRALALNPRFIPAYENLAGLMYAVEKYHSGDRELLEQGLRLAPENRRIDVGVAACDLRAGRTEQGRQRLQLILAASPAPSPEVQKLATDILQIDDWNRFSNRLEALFKSGQYAEVVETIDAERAQFPGPRFSGMLDQNRREALSFALIHRAVEAANRGDAKAATDFLEQVVNSNAGDRAKNEARRLLESVGKGKFGKRGNR